jgi:hypothetical protein
MLSKETMRVPADTPLAEELADDDVVEMANLTRAQIGVPGTIFISTAMGGHRATESGERCLHWLSDRDLSLPGAARRSLGHIAKLME